MKVKVIKQKNHRKAEWDKNPELSLLKVYNLESRKKSEKSKGIIR